MNILMWYWHLYFSKPLGTVRIRSAFLNAGPCRTDSQHWFLHICVFQKTEKTEEKNCLPLFIKTYPVPVAAYLARYFTFLLYPSGKRPNT